MMSATRTDRFGQPTSLSANGDMAAWNGVLGGFLSHAAATPDHLAKVLASDPDFALALACKGLFCALLGRAEMMATARQSYTEAKAAAERRPVLPREQLFIDALGDWLEGFPSRAALRLDAQLRAHPDDTLVMKMVQAIRFMLGDAIGMRTSAELALTGHGRDHAAHGYALGCHAFTLEETGDYDRAEATGRAGVEIAPDDAWGLHAVAHVHDMRADSAAGVAWLGNRHSAWAHCNNFRYHVWWHLALLHLDRGEIDAVLTLYDDHIRADRTDDYRDISNAASLLSRLEVDGHCVGNRWAELADICEGRTDDTCLPFADLHYLLALIGGKRETAITRLVGRMKRTATNEADEMSAIYARTGLDAAHGLEAFGEGNFRTAFRHLAHARSTMQTIGGSHAQRDVFERLTVEAAIRSGCHNAARTLLDERALKRGGRLDRFAAERLDLLAASAHATSHTAYASGARMAVG